MQFLRISRCLGSSACPCTSTLTLNRHPHPRFAPSLGQDNPRIRRLQSPRPPRPTRLWLPGSQAMRTHGRPLPLLRRPLPPNQHLPDPRDETFGMQDSGGYKRRREFEPGVQAGDADGDQGPHLVSRTCRSLAVNRTQRRLLRAQVPGHVRRLRYRASQEFLQGGTGIGTECRRRGVCVCGGSVVRDESGSEVVEEYGG